MKYNKINCNLLTIGNIPTSYHLSMTYEEQLLWILNKLEKEIIPDINGLIEFVENLDINFDTIYSQIDNINSEISTLSTNFNNIKEITEQNSRDIINLNNKITEDINNLDTELKGLINENYNTLKSYVDTQDSILNNKIDNIVIGNINVYDPTTGEITPLQIVLNNLAQASYKDGLTANEFDSLELSASGFDAYEITALDFDSNGKAILV